MGTTLVPHQITLRSGHRVLVRALRPDDAAGLAEAFEQLSETSRYRRFFTAKPRLSEQTLAFLTAVDHHDHEALVAVAPDSGQLLAVARFIRDAREPDHAEVAVTVADSWQRRGLGTALLRELAQRAAEEGIGYFTAEILAENQPVLTLADRLGDTETTRQGSTVSALIDLAEVSQEAGTSGYDHYDLLRAAARGEFMGLPAALREWLDLSGKIVATLLAPVSAFYETRQQGASAWYHADVARAVGSAGASSPELVGNTRQRRRAAAKLSLLITVSLRSSRGDNRNPRSAAQGRLAGHRAHGNPCDAHRHPRVPRLPGRHSPDRQ